MNTDSDSAFAHQELTKRIIGCFFRVYSALGYGFLESVYQRALQLELECDGLTVATEVPVAVHYKSAIVGEFRTDLVVNGVVLVELKATRTLDPAFEAQVLNYLRATDIEVALLLNFGAKPQIKRLVFDNDRKILSVSSV